MKLPIRLQDLDKELAARASAVREGVGLGIRNGARRARALLVRKSPKDTGHLKAGWRDTVSTGLAVKLGTGVVAEVYNDVPYAGIIEHGARPHPVSEEGQRAIFEWVKRNIPIMGPRAARPRKKADQFGAAAVAYRLDQLDVSMEQVAIAMGIIRKLRTRGQAPTYFVRDSLPDIRRGVGQEITRALKKVAGKPRAK